LKPQGLIYFILLPRGVVGENMIEKTFGEKIMKKGKIRGKKEDKKGEKWKKRH
jgi:hypothetical protein